MTTESGLATNVGGGEGRSLLARANALCDVAGMLVESTPEIRERVANVAAKLGQPLVVAVAGRIKAGKSTLVNAMLEQVVAPTAAGECTKVVTVYSYGSSELISVIPREGKPWEVGFDCSGRVPANLGATASDISRVEVRLSNEALRDLTIVDTPGLDSADLDSTRQARSFLGLDSASADAVAGADALVYLLPHPSEADADVLRSFRSMFTSSGFSACSIVGVVSRVDQLYPDADEPIDAAAGQVEKYLSDLRTQVVEVVPVIGLIAESTRAGVYRESDAAALRELAHQGERLDLALLSAEMFIDLPQLVAAESRRRLVEILGLHGIRTVLGRINRQDTSTTDDQMAALAKASGFEALRQVMHLMFEQRADVLKAHSVVSELDRISFLLDAGAADQLRDAIQTVRRDPQLHLLEEISVLAAWARGEIFLDPPLEDDLARLARSSDPIQRVGLGPVDSAGHGVEQAISAVERWQRVANDPRVDVATARSARIIHESFLNTWEALSAMPEITR